MKNVIFPISSSGRLSFLFIFFIGGYLLGFIQEWTTSFLNGNVIVCIFFALGMLCTLIALNISKLFTADLIINIQMTNRSNDEKQYIYSNMLGFQDFIKKQHDTECVVAINNNICSLRVKCEDISLHNRDDFVDRIKYDFISFCKSVEEQVKGHRELITIINQRKIQNLEIDNAKKQSKVHDSTLKFHKILILFGIIGVIWTVIQIIESFDK